MNIYLDNGATTKVAKEVIDEMNKAFENYGNPSSLHKLGRQSKEHLEIARETIAKKLNAKPNQIIFTSGGSESNNFVLKSIEGKIITTKIEHPSILNTCKTLQKNGAELIFLDVDPEGYINLEQLKKNIKGTKLVSIMHANNEIGTIQNLEEIGKICKENNVLFHTDAVQSFTKTELDVEKFNLDFVSLSAHKIHGPKGIGALYARNPRLLKPLIEGGSQENKKRAGTENVPGILGFAKATEIITKEDIKRMTKLRNKLIEELLKIPETKLNGPKERLCNNINISFKRIEGESILLHLDDEDIQVSTGSACSSSSLQPSHVLTALGLKPEIAHGSIRFTLSKYTTEQEIEITIQAVPKIIKKLRELSPL